MIHEKIHDIKTFYLVSYFVMKTYSALTSSQLLSNHSDFSHPHSSNCYQSKQTLQLKEEKAKEKAFKEGKTTE